MSSFVYLIQANNGDVKVGINSAPYARLGQSKRVYGVRRGFTDAYLVVCLPSQVSELVDSFTISLLEPYAARGEWFRVSFLYALRALLFPAKELTDGLVVMEGPAQPHVPVSPFRTLLA